MNNEQQTALAMAAHILISPIVFAVHPRKTARLLTNGDWNSGHCLCTRMRGPQRRRRAMAKPATYTIEVHHEDDGSYWAEVRELPGCFASGETFEELGAALGEAITIVVQ